MPRKAVNKKSRKVRKASRKMSHEVDVNQEKHRVKSERLVVK